MQTTVYMSPILVAKTSKGLNKFWQGLILTDDQDQAFTSSSYWQSTNSGLSAVLHSVPSLIVPKNVGRSNETTALQQARLEIDADYRKKLDKGYAPEGEGVAKEVQPPILPMLAHPYEKKKHTVIFPVMAQRKENGIRCLWDGENFWSRGGKVILPAATNHLRFYHDPTDGFVFDGELVLPEPFTFQETISAVKKFDPVVSPQLQYRIYDLYSKKVDLPFSTRNFLLMEVFDTDDLPNNVRSVATINVYSEEGLMRLHEMFVQGGVEGTIVRSLDGLYAPGQRSSDLLKLKTMVDAEYEIVGFTEGSGKDAGCVIFTCRTDSGLEFNVRPEGTVASRKQLFEDGLLQIGKRLTVRFQTLTDDGKPLFPVGVAVRDYEG